ncbi:MAG: GH36-type glycosyl hydrolase domain-containing protein [Halanaerobiales bacterium]
MQYGYFDSSCREYIISNPRTPTPWINYIGGGQYGGIISNTGGGYSFDGDPKNRRVLRYRYNNIPEDQPGRYIYLRDKNNGRYWSATWQPVKSEYDYYRCRHGLGYTIIEYEKYNIKSEVTYFVPRNESLEIWSLKITNKSNKDRELDLFSYAEFSFFDTVKDQQNLDWTQQIQQGEFEENTIFCNAHMKTWDYAFITSDLPVNSYTTSREDFVGRYRELSNPLAVERGKCSNNETKRGNIVGALNHNLLLAPGEEKHIIYILGTLPEKNMLDDKVKKYLSIDNVKKELTKLREGWQGYLDICQVETPDQDMNMMLNTWNPYQCRVTFNWSRFVSLYQLGIHRGMGFRDSAQDVLGVVHALPGETKKMIKRLLKCQKPDGNAYHLFYPLTGEGDNGEAGEDGSVDWYSDDHLWIILSVTAYIKETGDTDFLQQIVPYADNKGRGTVLEHLRQAIDFTENHQGPHGIPLAGFADWNDTINLDRGKGTAESVWTGMLYCYVLREMIELMEHIKNVDLAEQFRDYYLREKRAINEHGWDGSWYLRAFDDDGEAVGSNSCEKGKIFLNAQSWAIMAGIADKEHRQELLDNVNTYLNTDFGVVLVYPAYDKFDESKGGITTYPPGAKENGGIFLHTNPWIIIAETMAGNEERAFQYYRQVLPPIRNGIADKYEVEPYVYCQNILGKEHPQFGLGRNSWLTGTAAWMYRASTHYILGVRPDFDGIIIDPAAPPAWEKYTITRKFRGKTLYIECIKAEEKRMVVNGKEKGRTNKVYLEELEGEKNEIKVYY